MENCSDSPSDPEEYICCLRVGLPGDCDSSEILSVLVKTSIACSGTLSSSYIICSLFLQTRVLYHNKDERSLLLSTPDIISFQPSLFWMTWFSVRFRSQEHMHQKQFWMVSETESLPPGDYIPAEVSNSHAIKYILRSFQMTIIFRRK